MLKMPVRQLPPQSSHMSHIPARYTSMFLSIPEVTVEHRPDIAAKVIIKVVLYCMSEVFFIGWILSW